MNTTPITVRHLGLQPYEQIWRDMQHFTERRTTTTTDELWLLQHPPVFTLGKAGKTEHILNANHIPVIKSDRGGQVTYHGPGQLVGYCLIDLQQKHIGIKTLVQNLEQVIIDLLAKYSIKANTINNAPGVYIDKAKIASLGLRVKKGCTFHGFSLNVNMDLTPFAWINPCGFAGLQMTQLCDFTANPTVEKVAAHLQTTFCQQLHYE